MPGRQWKLSAKQKEKIRQLKRQGLANDALLERFRLTRPQLRDLLYQKPRGKRGKDELLVLLPKAKDEGSKYRDLQGERTVSKPG